MSDPFGAAIEAAVSRAIAAHFKSVEDRLTARIDNKLRSITKPSSLPPPFKSGERLVTTSEASQMLGVHKTTLLRYETLGVLPKRLALPSGHITGFKYSEMIAFIDALPPANGSVIVGNPMLAKQKGPR